MATLRDEIPLLPGPLELLPDDALAPPVFRAEVAAAAAELTAEAAGETELLGGALRALEFEAADEQTELAANRPELTDAELGVAAAAAGTTDPALAEMVATLELGDQLVHEVEALVPEQDPEPIAAAPSGSGGVGGSTPSEEPVELQPRRE